MAVAVNQLLMPLIPANVRSDLIYLATLIGLTISVRPSDPTFKLIDWLAKWFCYYWNTYAIPALAGQFGATAAGSWLTAWAMARGIARPLATFATGLVTVENRSLVFVDVSAVGAASITYNGITYVSQGPAPGFSGTMGAAVGATYLQTTLIVQATQAGPTGNVPANTLPGYPTALAAGPTGVYVATSSSTPPAGNGIIAGSSAMSDPALYQLVLASNAASAVPGSPLAKYIATVLTAQLPGGVAVATSRVRVYGSGGVVNVACATPTGPTPGSLATAGSELYQINAAVQLACAQPGMTVIVAAALAQTINLANIVLYLDAASGVTAAQAKVTAAAAFTLWQSLLPIGGERLSGGGTGYALFNAITDAFQSQINPGYPAPWTPNTYYAAGSQVSYNGQTFIATSPGTSGSLVGPSGIQPFADGGSGLMWNSTTVLGGGPQLIAAPGVIDVTISGISADVAFTGINYVASFNYSLSAILVPQS